MVLIIILLYFHAVRSECIIDNRSRENVWELDLHKHLLGCHSSTRSPKPNDTVNVAVSFAIKHYTFDSEEEVFAVGGSVRFEWQDDRLKWNPSEYDGINETIISSFNIWAPAMRLFNIADQDDQEYFYSTCKVKSDGQVKCRPGSYFKIRCATKLAKWPLDSQTCVLEFGEWSKFGAVRYKIDRPVLVYIKAAGQWKAVKIKQENIRTSDVHIRLTFTMKRNAFTLVPTVIHPCIILSVFTTLSLLLDARDGLRSPMICFSLVCHMYLLSAINEYIPAHSTYAPTILLYYRGSMAITTIGAILTFVLRAICKRGTTPPAWLSSVNEVVLKGREKLTMWPRWKSDEGKHSQQWADFANLVNTIYFVASVITYVDMYLEFIPSD